MGYRIPDVAGTWQGTMDWRAVDAELQRRYPADTMPAGIAKLSEGLHFVDPQGARNISELRRIGKKAIGYHCVTAHDDPVLQARLFAALLEQYGADGAMYDWESFYTPNGKHPASAQTVAQFHAALRRVWSRGPSLLYFASWVIGAGAGTPGPDLLALPLVLGNPNIHDLDSLWPDGPVLHQYGQEQAVPGVGTGSQLDCSTGSDRFLALFTPTKETAVSHTVILANDDHFLRGENRRVNGYESHPDLAGKVAVGGPVTEAEIVAVDQYAMDWINKEIAAYDRSLEAPVVTVDVDEAKIAHELRNELRTNPLVIDLTGHGA